MPTYQYRCNSCLKEFERFQGIKDLPIKKCPFCFKKSLDRLIGSGSAIIFRGSGFYCNDYKDKNEEN